MQSLTAGGGGPTHLLGTKSLFIAQRGAVVGASLEYHCDNKLNIVEVKFSVQIIRQSQLKDHKYLVIKWT